MMDLAVALIRLLPAEAAHHLTVELTARFGLFVPRAPADDPRLGIRVLGRDFPNPLGLAAGFDKNARAFRAMLKMGFGHVECGTVTPRPQPGNPRPRLFRLPEERAVVNRMGFDNHGMERIGVRLARRRKGIVGINIGANRDSADRIADYRIAFARLAPLAEYVAVNVSSPNTPGLRKLQDREELHKLLSMLAEARGGKAVPLLLKIAPDLEEAQMDDIAAEALGAGIDGLIVTNTTVSRPPALKGRYAAEEGGLSGKPLFGLSTEVLKAMRQRVGDKLVLIGVGGVTSGATAYAKIRAGASLVQLYTALVYRGPGLVTEIKRDMLERMRRDGFSTIAEAVGADVKA